MLVPAFEIAIFGGDFGLRVEAGQLRSEFDADVFDAGKVLARIGDAALGLAPPFTILGYARGLLQKNPQLLGPRLDDAGNHALLDDRVGTRPEAGPEEQIVNVAAAYRNIVDVVGRVAIAREHALDG